MKKLRIVLSVVVLLTGVLVKAAEREVTVVNAKDGVSLAGTLTTPDAAPKAAVVLATGSGAQNRDEEVLGHKPFKRIADYLGTRGYAVLRLDDRGVGGSGGDASRMTAADYAADLACAVAYLDSCLNVPVGALGHSEGGSAVVMLANTTPTCRFIVTLGAPAWRGDSIIMSQARAMALASGGEWAGEAMQRRYLDLVMSDLPEMLLRPALYTAVATDLGDMAKIPEVQSSIRQQTEAMCRPSYRGLVKYDPAADIAAVTVPWLALYGEKDTQVLPGNADTLRGLNQAAKVVMMPGHNHLFQRCVSGAVQEYAGIAEDISEETLETIVTFLDTLGQDNFKPR